MANDIADWSSSVVVQSGSVTINGTASVSVANTPQVTIAAGQSIAIAGTPTVYIAAAQTIGISGTAQVNIASQTGNLNVVFPAAQSVSVVGTATVSISGTPSVTISGTPTVILGAGTASVGSISSIGSTVTIAGTVNIGNTPAVTISGTANVSIVSGSVNIGNTPNITITGQTITVGVGQQWTAVGSVAVVGAGAVGFDTNPVDVKTQQLAICIETGTANGVGGLGVSGNQSGMFYLSGLAAAAIKNGYVTIPVNGALDSTYHVFWQNAQGVPFTVAAYATSMPWVPVTAGLYGAFAATVSLAEDQSFMNRGFTSPQRGMTTQPHAAAAQAFSQPATGVVASITLAATTGVSWVIQDCTAELAITTAVAAALQFQTVDGGITSVSHYLTCPAAAWNIDRVHIVAGGNSFTQQGQSLVLKFLSANANTDQAISVVAVQQ